MKINIYSDNGLRQCREFTEKIIEEQQIIKIMINFITDLILMNIQKEIKIQNVFYLKRQINKNIQRKY